VKAYTGSAAAAAADGEIAKTISYQQRRDRLPVRFSYAFSSKRKRMSSVVNVQVGVMTLLRNISDVIVCCLFVCPILFHILVETHSHEQCC
jgi:hypothetical protein